MTEQSRPADTAALFESSVVPVLLGIGLAVAGILYLFTVSPRIAFGVSLVLLGSLISSIYA